MVLARTPNSDWDNNNVKLKRVSAAINTPPHTKTLCQIAEENGFGADGEQMCRLLVTYSLYTESQLNAYRKKVRALSGGEVK